MENKTGFDLNSAIADWRTAMKRGAFLDAEALRELESHLREAVAALAVNGLSHEEAFLIARRRMGGTAELRTEFGVVNPELVWRRHLFMLVLTPVFTWLFAEFLATLLEALPFFGIPLLHSLRNVPLLLAFALLAAWSVVRRIARETPGNISSSPRNAGYAVAYGIVGMKAFNILLFPALFWLADIFSGQPQRVIEPAPAGVIAAYATRQCLWILLAAAVGIFVTKFSPMGRRCQSA